MNANGKQAPVLVVGGGIGGLGAALALSRKGIPVHVIEQAPEFKEIGAGIHHFLLPSQGWGAVIDTPESKTYAPDRREELRIWRSGIRGNPIAAIKKRFGQDVFLSVDVCLCSYTSHGHCGILNDSMDHVICSLAG